MPINLAGSGQQLDQSLPTIITGFKLLRDYDGVMRRLATPMPLEPHTGTSKIILNYSRVTAFVVADGVDIVQAQDLADAQTTITPSEVAVQVILAGSTMRRVADPALLRRTGQILENAYNLKEDQDGCTQLASFTTTLGGGSTVIGAGHIAAAVTSIATGNNTTTPEPAPDPIVGVFHPCTLHSVMQRLVPFTDVPTGTNVYAPVTSGRGSTIGAGAGMDLSDQLVVQGLKAMGQIAGIPIYMDANFSIASSQAISGVFSKEGLIYCNEVEPHLDDEKDASLRGAIELNYWGAYGWQNYRAGAFGAAMNFDASLPTA